MSATTSIAASPSSAAPEASGDVAAPAVVISGPLWRDRDFSLFMVGQGVSALGDAISLTALPLLVLTLTGSGTQMGMVGMLQSVPTLLLGLLAGTLADRWDRRRMMLVCDVLRALLVLAIPLSVLLGLPTMVLVYVVAFPLGVLYAFFEAACLSCMPSLVGRSRLAEANALGHALNSIGAILGPGLAGIVAGWIGPGYTLGIDAATFLVSALSLALIRRPLQEPQVGEAPPLLRGTWEGIRFLLDDASLRTMMGFWSFSTLLIAPLIPAVTYLMTVDLAMGPTALGMVISAYCVGSLIGAVLSALLRGRNMGGLLLVGKLVCGGTIALLPLLPTLPMMLLLSFVAGAANSLSQIAYVTLRTTLTPDALLGRVSSITRMITYGLTPLGMLAGGLLLDWMGGRATLALMGGGTVLLCALFALKPLLRGMAPTGALGSSPE